MKIEKIIQNEKDLVFGQSTGSPFLIHFEKWDKDGFFITRRRSERKAWIYSACITEDFIAAMAIVDAGYLATAFAYFFHFQENIFFEEKAGKPFGFSDSFKPTLWETWQLKDGKNSWLIKSKEEKLFFSFSSEKRKMDWEMEILSDGINALAPSAGRPFNYTYKNVLLPVKAQITYSGKDYTALGKNGALDFSAGYPPRNTRWNWASLNGKTQKGPFGANFVEHHNSGLENGIWLGDEILLLKEVFFHYTPPMEKNPTLIECPEINLKIEFTPKGARKEKINLFALISDFVQPFGNFSGSFVYKGETYFVSGTGVVEDHRALW